MVFYYDAPTPPSGVFDDFLATDQVSSDVQTRTLSELVKAQTPLAASPRGLWRSVSITKYTVPLLEQIVEQLNVSICFPTLQVYVLTCYIHTRSGVPLHSIARAFSSALL
jgi:hypothetical protein